MFDCNNNVSTVLLLVILALIIWHLTLPKKKSEQIDSTSTDIEGFVNELPQPTLIVIPTDVEASNVPDNTYPNNHTIAPINRLVNTDPEASIIEGNYTSENQVQQPNGTVNNYNAVIGNSGGSYINDSIEIPDLNGDITNPVGNENSAMYNTTVGVDINSAFKLIGNDTTNTVNNIANGVVNINNNVTDYNSKDYLPKEINKQWFDTDFSQAKTNIEDDKLINTERYVIGINTVGQSLKNASYDIRGTIANPKFSISPWNNSTYEPDYNIKPLC